MSAELAGILTSAGKVAGLAGLSIALVLILFRQVLALNIFPMMDRERAFRILRMIIVLTVLVALAGLATYLIGQYFISKKVDIAENSPCAFNIKNENSSNSKITVGEITCTNAPKSRVRITYYWLDGASYSSLSVGTPVPGVKALTGESPHVIHTAAYDAFTSKLGSPMSESRSRQLSARACGVFARLASERAVARACASSVALVPLSSIAIPNALTLLRAPVIGRLHLLVKPFD